MKFCSTCGHEVPDNAVVCVNCGSAVSKTPTSNTNDAPNTGFAVLGFFIPIVGLILYLVNKDSAPLKAKSAGKGALIGFIVNIAVSVIYGIVGGILMSMSYYM